MEQGFLMDTNVVIDYLGNKLPPSGAALMSNYLKFIFSRFIKSGRRKSIFNFGMKYQHFKNRFK